MIVERILDGLVLARIRILASILVIISEQQWVYGGPSADTLLGVPDIA